MKSLYLLLVLVLGLFIFPGISHAKKGDVCNPKAPGCNAVYETCPRTLKQVIKIKSTNRFKYMADDFYKYENINKLTTKISWFGKGDNTLYCCLKKGPKPKGYLGLQDCIGSRRKYLICERVSKHHKFKCIPK